MPTVPYNESLYRTGFRPTNTDPFAATQMMAGIFSPQRLHGMGQGGKVFTREGGWALHGLGAIVPDGAIVTYQGKWPLTQWTGATDILSQVQAAISHSGALAVRNSTSDASWTQNTPPFPLNSAPFGVTLTLQVTNGMGFGDPNDIISIIRHFVYEVTGQFPIADTIPSFQVPGASGGQPPIDAGTGQPEIPGAPKPDDGDWGTWLQNNAVLIGGMVVAAMVLPKVLGR